VAVGIGGRALLPLEERGFMSDHQEAVAKVAELAKGIRIAMLTTVDEEGHLVARPMAQQEVEFDGDLWFFAERDSSTVTQLQANPHVGVSLSSNDTWVSICGTAAVVQNPAKAHDLWNSFVGSWFPQGPDDPTVALIKVTADCAEYWDTPGGRVASILSFVKAKATGSTYEGSDNQKINL
jgi:general stress protein 26